ncbi:MAG: hypothetical protein NTW38_05715 [Candidatus Aminicenantes bacterium]|nr:hypothetical protein [Candidatus Aminicenantes bacterium]
MKTCRRWRKEFDSSPEGFPLPADRSPWKEHLAMCPDCRKHWEDAEKIMKGADALKEDVRTAMTTVDWDALSERIADAALARPKTSPSRAREFPGWPRAFIWKPAFAGVLGGLLIGASVTYFALRAPNAAPPADSEIHASGEFIDRAELSVAKRETLDYLSKSQSLLLDFVQASPEEAGRLLHDEAAAGRASDLLAKKRFMNSHLDDASIAKARGICDQIERLFVELSQISGDLSTAEAVKIQKYIEDKQLLLRIKLLRKELAESEV